MRKRKTHVKNASTAGDPQLREFITKDLAADIRASGSAVVIRPQRPTSILLSETLVAKLRKKAAKRGLGYQTMLKLIVAEHIDEY